MSSRNKETEREGRKEGKKEGGRKEGRKEKFPNSKCEVVIEKACKVTQKKEKS